MQREDIAGCNPGLSEAASGAKRMPVERPHVIIPVHNRRETTRRCLAHLQSQDIPAWCRIIVVDDGSTDGTSDMIRDNFPWCTVIRGSGDLWWAGAIHLGMRLAMAVDAECICWLNDDTLPDAGALHLLVSTALARQAVCGGWCRGSDGSALAYAGGFMHGGWPQPFSLPSALETAIRVDWLHGNLIAIPRCVWRRIGLPEHRFMRHNLSDIDYTHRAHQYGITVLLIPQASAVAAINTNLSYRSWYDPLTSAAEIVAGLWLPRTWWYFPGLAYFLLSQRSWTSTAFLFRFLAKIPAAVVLKFILPNPWLQRLKTCKRSPSHRKNVTQIL
jgi:GT2 family glycosyltransferase